MDTNLLNLICGFVLGYATWNIVNIIRTDKQNKKIPNDIIYESNPLKVAYKTLTTRFNMPKEKCILTENDSTLAIAYGHSCVVMLNMLEEGVFSVAIVVDKTTTQSDKDKQKEFEELKRLITDAEFGSSNFARSLAFITVALSKAEKEKFSNVTRQIPHDML